MNSMSKGYYNDDCDYCKKEKRHHDDDCCKKEKKPCPTIIKCGGNGSVTIPLAATAPVGTTFRLAALNLDTSKLCNPTVKLEFSSNIATLGASVGSVTIQINKRCRNDFNPVPVGMPMTFTTIAALALTASTFSFNVCDCGICDDECCTYTVDVTVSDGFVTSGITISNATLIAIATCGSSSCNC